MAPPLRTGALIGALWGIDLLFLALVPVARTVLDPLLAGLIFLACVSRSSRFLWLAGLWLGLLKDLNSADMFGSWAVAFGLSGWMLGAARHLVEWEDPVIVGVWAAAFTLLNRTVQGLWLLLADPWLRWGHGSWLLLPAAMALQGWACAALFPLFQRVMRGSLDSRLPRRERSL